MEANELVSSFDHHTVEYQVDGREMFNTLRGSCPVAHSDKWGGFYVMTKYDDIWAAMRDHGTFSSAKSQDESGTWHGGDVIPDVGMPPFYPLDLDPPLHQSFRQILNPFLSPASVEQRSERILGYISTLIDAFIERGDCEFVTEFANPAPAISTVEMLGLEVTEWRRWAEPHHSIQFAEHGTAEHEQAIADLVWQRDQLAAAIRERLETPRDDMITHVANARIDGRPIEPEEGAALLWTVVGGGVDTSTAFVTNALAHLSEHPEQRAWLLEDLDARLPAAIEELLRYYPPVRAVARTVRQEVEVGGQRLCPADRVLLPVLAANFDPEQFDRPGEVILDREPNRHATFGIGVHRCVGSSVARFTVTNMIREVLTRMPDYRFDLEKAVRYRPSSPNDGWVSMPATFTPGPKLARPT